jgi:hypothetical protein
MFVCPYDARWCNRTACRTGSCELTGERPFIACIGCGAVTETSPGFRLCVDCLILESGDAEEGA